MTKTTYQKLLEVAYLRFTHQGLQGINIEQTAKQAGYTKGAFYKTGFKLRKKAFVMDVLAYGFKQASWPTEAAKIKTWEEYKRRILLVEEEMSFVRQVLLLDNDKDFRHIKLEFEKRFAKVTNIVATLLADTPNQKKALLQLIPGVGQQQLINSLGLTWEERCRVYFEAVENIKTNTVP